MRTRTLVLLAVVATVLPVWASGVARGGRATPGVPLSSSVEAPRSPQVRALTVLRHWDVRRAAAWAAGDPTALDRLYLPGSRTGERDLHDLRRWVRRGLRVTGLREQVRAVRVVRPAPRSMVVVVTDRTVDGVAVGSGAPLTAVPTSAWATHRVLLRRVAGGWRVGEVRIRAQPAR